MAKIQPISGFPEWLPQYKIVEDGVIATIKDIYLSHGFTPIETRSVELMSTLASRGDINKEIYVIDRAQGEREPVSDATLALHFDLTIPFARYVAQNFSELDFPFKRYQLQKSWRGERPQEGRFREFYQFDIDVVAIEDLPLCHDAEMVTVIYKIFRKLSLGEFTININNRKLLLGIYEHFGLTDQQKGEAIVIVDKISKIGAEAVKGELVKCSIAENVADAIISIAGLRLNCGDFGKEIEKLGPTNELFKEGAAELSKIIELILPETQSAVCINLSLARGLDYYTGTIIETTLNDYPNFGSVAGGGRYANLTSRFGTKFLPGVGISVGLTRLMSLIVSRNLIAAGRKCPTTVLITLNGESDMRRCFEIAETLRHNGISSEVFHKALKLGKQISYADNKGIPFVLFIKDNGAFELKEMLTKEQREVSMDDLITALKSLN